MKVLNSAYIERGVTKIKNILHHTTPKEAPVQLASGSEAVAAQAKALLKLTKNYVEPAQEKFSSTKSMLGYAKTRCIDTLKKENVEHSVLFDLKENKVLAEFKGDAKSCPIDNLEVILANKDRNNIGVMHGHPENFPLSYNDVKFIRDYGINQIIAVDVNGEFSFVGRQNIVPKKSGIKIKDWFAQRSQAKKEEAAFLSYSATSSDDVAFYRNAASNEGWKCAIHDTLQTYIPSMNMRYVTNYAYLKK